MKSTTRKATKDIFDILKGNTAQERLLHRLHSVTLFMQGLSVRETARIYGDSPRSVAYWIKRFKEDGVDGLDEEARSGRPSKLNPSQMKRLQNVLIQLRKQSKPVNATVVSGYIREHCDVTLTIRQCERILKRIAM